MSTTFTAEITSLNSPSPADDSDWTAGATAFDTVTVRDSEGNEVASFTVESSEDHAPYAAALAAAGYAAAEWVD